MPTLIINADDFGMSDAVTDGIIQAWQHGVVSSSSAIINLPDARYHVRHAPPDLPLGLHLNITTGTPCSDPQDIPTLVDRDGCFFEMPYIVSQLSRISLDDLRHELFAQAAAMRQIRPFDHIDYHYHLVALYHPFFAIVMELADQYGVPVRQPVLTRHIRLTNRSIPYAAIRHYTSHLITRPHRTLRPLWQMRRHHHHRLAADLHKQTIRSPQHVLIDLHNHGTHDHFSQITRQLRSGVSEIITHPATHIDDNLRRYGGRALQTRLDELTLLCDPATRSLLQRSDIDLITYSDL